MIAGMNPAFTIDQNSKKAGVEDMIFGFAKCPAFSANGEKEGI
jgi:hypothetical protein